MKRRSGREKLSYKVERFVFRKISRYILIPVSGLKVPYTASIYEQSYSARKSRATGTAGTVMQHLAYLFSWAEEVGISLDERLLTGCGLDYSEIEIFDIWLALRLGEVPDVDICSKYRNYIMRTCKRFSLWFVYRYCCKFGSDELDPFQANLYREKATAAHKVAWEQNIHGFQNDQKLKDLSTVEYESVEWYLNPNQCSDLPAEKLRNYIIWRLVWEFGLRIGEVLALRLGDLFLYGTRPYIRVERITARGDGYEDSRGSYAPRIKTLSRDLGFIEPCSVILELIDVYLRKHRMIALGDGVNTQFLKHDFLLIAHDGTGNPISASSAQKIAEKIAENCGFHFHWHLGRHAFFNRKYKEAVSSRAGQSAIEQLIYWGGWASEKSIKIYSLNAIAEIAKNGLRAELNRRDEL